MGLKISASYWATCTQVEQLYIQTRCHENFDKHHTYDVSGVKSVISAARKQFAGKEISRIYGKGFVVVDNELWLYSGSDTKYFYKITYNEAKK